MGTVAFCGCGGFLWVRWVLEVLGDLTNQTLEGELADEKLSRLLVATNLTESDGTGLVAVRLLGATGRGGRPARSLGGELLRQGLGTGGLASGLLGASDCLLLS